MTQSLPAPEDRNAYEIDLHRKPDGRYQWRLRMQVNRAWHRDQIGETWRGEWRDLAENITDRQHAAMVARSLALDAITLTEGATLTPISPPETSEAVADDISSESEGDGG